MPDMADNKLIGQNYTTPDLVAKVTGKAKYAEDYRVEGMLFAKLLVSPYPHARVKRCDTSAALAMPGVKAILRAEDMPGAAGGAAGSSGRARAFELGRRRERSCRRNRRGSWRGRGCGSRRRRWRRTCA